ncbi:hypothetical protein BC332_17388 [Capsicum chinense]|nr:hypothetical protein BC332_17388 [Capsicum chinense]
MSNPVEEIVSESTMENKHKAFKHNDSCTSASSTDDDDFMRRPVQNNNKSKPIHSTLVSLAISFFWSNLSFFVNKRFIELPKIVLPEESWMQFVLLLRDQCTCAFGIFREVASGDDLKKFLYAIFGLWIVSIVGRWFSLLTLVYLLFVMMLTVPCLYEKYEDQVNAYGKMAIKELRKQYSQVDEKADVPSLQE